MDTNMQFTINSFRQLFPDKIFFPDKLAIPDISRIFSKIPDSCQIPDISAFPDKWSPRVKPELTAISHA